MGLNSWYQLKLFIAHASGISMDAWHILVGVAAFLLIARLLDSNVTRPLPWLVLLAAELINEAYDIHVERWPDLGSQLGEGAKDIMLTMALPTLISLVARWWPHLLTARDDPGNES
jgi:hypothetical protein